MAVFKAIEKKMGETKAILQNVKHILKCLEDVIKAFNKLIKTLKDLFKNGKRVVARLRTILRILNGILAKAGKLAGPFKILTTIINKILEAINKVFTPLNGIVDKIKEAFEALEKKIKLKARIKAFKDLLDKLCSKVDKVKKVAALLEQQQQWLEKILAPAFLKKLWDLVKAFDNPLKTIKKLTTKIIDALKALLDVIAGVQKQADDLNNSFKEIDKWLKNIDEFVKNLKYIIDAAEKLLNYFWFTRKALWVLKKVGDLINYLLKKLGVLDLLDWIIKQSGLIEALTKGIGKILGAIDKLKQAFDKILDDLKDLQKELVNLFKLVSNLDSLLKLIGIIKTFFGMFLPKNMDKFRKGLELLEDPNAIPQVITDDHLLLTTIQSIKINGKGIGDDWILKFSIGNVSQELAVDPKDSSTTHSGFILNQESIPLSQKSISRTIKVVATEIDPVYNDVGNGSTTIKLTNSPQEKEDVINFTVNASGGDQGAQAEITIVLHTRLEAIEEVMIPLSDLGANYIGLNYIEHAINDLKQTIGDPIFAPGLLKEQLTLQNFVKEAEFLTDKIRVILQSNPDDSRALQNVIAEFKELIAVRSDEIIPKEELNFDESYFITLHEEVTSDDTGDVDEVIFELLDDIENEVVDPCECYDITEEDDFLDVYFNNDFDNKPFDLELVGAEALLELIEENDNQQ